MKRMLITSALPYVNNVPHLGNIIGATLSADVFARFCRSRGYSTRFICGTDEHGTTTEVKALEEGLSPMEVCDKYFKIHSGIYHWFNISFDTFGRTSSDTHRKFTQEIFLKLHKNGFISEDFLDELYCNSCKKSLADRFVEGKCPHCMQDGAKGDQCDKCGHLLNPFELISPKCKICKNKPVKKTTKHLFLDLEKLQPEIKSWADKQSADGEWSENTITYTNAWFKEGLRKRCISRQLNWGIPIPLTGYEKMVFYVWFDAPIGYISITAHKFGDWKDWWKNPEHVELYQFMGKDNVPFHTILFPGTLLGTREKYTLAHHISTTEFLNYESAKFSKSNGTGVFGDDAINTKLPADGFRYYLLANRPERSDTVFSWDDFQEKYNSELIGNLANLVNRTLVFLKKFYGSKIPDAELSDYDKDVWLKIEKQEKTITRLLEKVKIKDALKELMGLCSLGNKYFQESEPWVSVKANKAKADASMMLLVSLVKDIAVICEPFIPHTSKKIFSQLNIEPQPWSSLGCAINAGHKLNDPKALFEKLTDKHKENLKKKYLPDQVKEQNKTDSEALYNQKPMKKIKGRNKAEKIEKAKPEMLNKSESILDKAKKETLVFQAAAGLNKKNDKGKKSISKTILSRKSSANKFKARASQAKVLPSPLPDLQQDSSATKKGGFAKILKNELPSKIDLQPNSLPMVIKQSLPLNPGSQIDPMLLNLRVAQIKDAYNHPQADKLMILKLNDGTVIERQIVAGIRSYYSREELLGKKIIIVANLMPANLRGVESQGMLLACGGEAGRLGLLTVQKSKPGTMVSYKGAWGFPNNSQISIGEFSKINLEGNHGIPHYNGHKLLAGKEKIFIENNAEGKIR